MLYDLTITGLTKERAIEIAENGASLMWELFDNGVIKSFPDDKSGRIGRECEVSPQDIRKRKTNTQQTQSEICPTCKGHGELSKPPYDDSGICPECKGTGELQTNA